MWIYIYINIYIYIYTHTHVCVCEIYMRMWPYIYTYTCIHISFVYAIFSRAIGTRLQTSSISGNDIGTHNWCIYFIYTYLFIYTSFVSMQSFEEPLEHSYRRPPYQVMTLERTTHVCIWHIRIYINIYM